MGQSRFSQPSRLAFRTLSAIALLFTMASSVLAASDTVPPPNTPQAEAATLRLYLPLIMNTGTTPPPPPPPSASGGIFLDRAVKTASAATAIDARGYHAAYIHFVPEVEHPPAV